MRGHAFFLFFSFLAIACSDLKSAQTTAGDGGDTPPSGDPDGGAGPTPGGSVQVTVETLVDGRSRLGARSAAGFRPWRTGIAVNGGQVYWVESGSTPGLYAIGADCASPCTPQKLSSMTRPTAFTSDATAILVADATQLLRVPFAALAGGTFGSQKLATATDDIVNIASDGTNAFWTSGTAQDIERTTSQGTSAIMYSNGTPVGMAVASDKVYWAGVDISGQIGALQRIGTDGKGAGEVSRFTGGFHAMQGNASYLYYAKETPGSVHRIDQSSGHDEVVDKDAYGVTDFALDDQYAYWVEPGDSPDYANGRVRRVAHAGSTAETLAASMPLPVAVAVAGNTVYVLSAGTKGQSYADGKVLRLTLTP